MREGQNYCMDLSWVFCYIMIMYFSFGTYFKLLIAGFVFNATSILPAIPFYCNNRQCCTNIYLVNNVGVAGGSQ